MHRDQLAEIDLKQELFAVLARSVLAQAVLVAMLEQLDVVAGDLDAEPHDRRHPGVVQGG